MLRPRRLRSRVPASHQNRASASIWSPRTPNQCLAGASLPPLVLFRIAKKPNTRIATTAIPCRVRRLGVSQGTTKRCCIIEPPVSPWRRAGREFYSTVPNSLLEIGGCARDTCWDGRACLGVTHSSQASAEHSQQCAEFLPLSNRGLGPLAVPCQGARRYRVLCRLADLSRLLRDDDTSSRAALLQHLLRSGRPRQFQLSSTSGPR